MYIIHPVKFTKHSLNSKIGKKILKNYIKIIFGGSNKQGSNKPALTPPSSPVNAPGTPTNIGRQLQDKYRSPSIKKDAEDFLHAMSEGLSTPPSTPPSTQNNSSNNVITVGQVSLESPVNDDSGYGQFLNLTPEQMPETQPKTEKQN